MTPQQADANLHGRRSDASKPYDLAFRALLDDLETAWPAVVAHVHQHTQALTEEARHAH